MNELSKHPASIEIYKTICETWRSQVDSYWLRSNYFAAFETAALGGCWYLIHNQKPRMGFLGTILGILLTIVWLRSNTTVHHYVEYWWGAIKEIEKKLSLSDEGFDFASKHPGSGSRIRYSKLVQCVPWLFMAAWVLVVFYFLAHVRGRFE